MATPQSFTQYDANVELNLDEARTVFSVIPDAYDTNERVVKIAMLVWDTVSLSWVKYTGSSGGGGAVTIADGADAAEGLTTDVAVVTDVNGTVSGKLRGLVKIFASVWDSVNGRLKVDGSAVTQPVSGTVTANAGAGPFLTDPNTATLTPTGATQEQKFLTLTTTASTAVFAAGGVGVKHYVTHIHVSNTSGTGVLIQLMDGVTNIWDTFAAASGGGAEADFSVPLVGSAATALNVQAGAAVTDVRVTVVGYFK